MSDNYTIKTPIQILIGRGKRCLETLVHEIDMNNSRDEIKRKQDIG